jgi:hypothetical protein
MPARADRRGNGLRWAAWLFVSVALHALLWLRARGETPAEPSLPFALPTQVQFGLASAPTREKTAPAPGPASAATTQPKPRAAARIHPKPARDPNAYGTARAPMVGAGTPEPGASDARGAAQAEADGDANGLAPLGATLALNVDLDRVRRSALVLELPAVLDLVPEWQKLLAGSGLEPLSDLDRVFVAMPDAQSASSVVAAQHHLPRARLEAAVSQLAAADGRPAAFRPQEGLAVAAWRNRGPSERVIALTGADQFIIARAADLARVLAVSRALAETRKKQGFSLRELDAQGGLLAMQEREAIALWIEGLGNYVRGDVTGLPRSLRLSISQVDQFHTELGVRGQYLDAADAAAALRGMEARRAELSHDPQLSFLGLSSAITEAVLERDRAALVLHVQLTLHQTRYLLRFVRRLLHR